MPRHTSYRLSEITLAQIADLVGEYKNRTTVITVAVDRLWRDTMSERNKRNIRVKSVDTKPTHDPYVGNGAVTVSEFWLDPQARVCQVYQSMRTGGTDSRIYHGIELTTQTAHCNASRLRDALEGEAAQALLRRVCDGHDVVWDGQNHRGILTEDARDAWYDLCQWLENSFDDDYECVGVEGGRIVATDPESPSSDGIWALRYI